MVLCPPRVPAAANGELKTRGKQRKVVRVQFQFVRQDIAEACRRKHQRNKSCFLGLWEVCVSHPRHNTAKFVLGVRVSCHHFRVEVRKHNDLRHPSIISLSRYMVCLALP